MDSTRTPREPRGRRLGALLGAALLACAPACGDAADGATTTDSDGPSDAASDARPADVTGAGADSSDVGAGPSWEALPEVLGGPIQENAVVGLGGRIYLLGGFRNGFAITDQVVSYGVASRTWAEEPPLPRPLHHVGAAAIGDRLVVVNALSGLSFGAEAVAWSWAPGDASWQARTPLSDARRRGGSGVAALGSDVYVLGGVRGGASSSVADADVYRALEDRWEALPDLPAPRDHLVAAAVGGVVYALGGRDEGVDAVAAEVWAFDPDLTDAGWVARAPMPTARGGCMAGVVAGRIVVAGGEGNPDHPRRVFPQVEAYDPVTDSWSALPPMPTPRHGTGAVGWEGRLYVPAGADKELFQAVDVFEALTP